MKASVIVATCSCLVVCLFCSARSFSWFRFPRTAPVHHPRKWFHTKVTIMVSLCHVAMFYALVGRPIRASLVCTSISSRFFIFWLQLRWHSTNSATAISRPRRCISGAIYACCHLPGALCVPCSSGGVSRPCGASVPGHLTLSEPPVKVNVT